MTVSLRTLSGWGRVGRSTATVVDGASAEDVAELLTDPLGPPVLARGLGRSYGDAALNEGGVVVVRPGGGHANPVVDVEGRRVRVPAQTGFAELLATVVPLGLCLPVLPGTRHVTLGGAIAADVHGKNHRHAGSICDWLDEIVLLDGTGTERHLSPADDPAAFYGTIGGMGLTGVMLSATLRLLAVPTSWMWVRTRRLRWDDLLAAMSASTSPYQVAWIDLSSRGRTWGRGILDEGRHALPDQLPRRARGHALGYRPRRALPVPTTPVSVVAGPTARAFDALWWRRAADDTTRARSLSAFFHQLDGIAGWNRFYGPSGLLQYQFVVPLGAEDVLESCARLLSTVTTFLPVLKRLGHRSRAPLSFPLPGWTLAVDIPAGSAGVGRLLERADELVAQAGGRVYLAKDSRLSPSVLGAMYPRLDEWLAVRQRLDPHGRLRSDLGRRLGLC